MVESGVSGDVVESGVSGDMVESGISDDVLGDVLVLWGYCQMMNHDWVGAAPRVNSRHPRCSTSTRRCGRRRTRRRCS